MNQISGFILFKSVFQNSPQFLVLYFLFKLFYLIYKHLRGIEIPLLKSQTCHKISLHLIISVKFINISPILRRTDIF